MKRAYNEYLDFLQVREDYLNATIASALKDAESNKSYIRDCSIALAQSRANRAVLIRHNPVEPYGEFCESCSMGRSYDEPESKFPCEPILEITNELDKVMGSFGYWVSCSHCGLIQWFPWLVDAKLYKNSEELQSHDHNFVIAAGESNARPTGREGQP